MSCTGCLVWLQEIVQKSFASLHAGVYARNLYIVSQSISVGSIHRNYVSKLLCRLTVSQTPEPGSDVHGFKNALIGNTLGFTEVQKA